MSRIEDSSEMSLNSFDRQKFCELPVSYVWLNENKLDIDKALIAKSAKEFYALTAFLDGHCGGRDKKTFYQKREICACFIYREFEYGETGLFIKLNSSGHPQADCTN